MQLDPLRACGPLSGIIRFLAILGLMTIFAAGLMVGYVLGVGLNAQ